MDRLDTPDLDRYDKHIAEHKGERVNGKEDASTNVPQEVLEEKPQSEPGRSSNGTTDDVAGVPTDGASEPRGEETASEAKEEKKADEDDDDEDSESDWYSGWLYFQCYILNE